MAKLMHIKMKGFTLIETVVAMVIVMLSFGIATTVFVNVRNAKKAGLRLKAAMAMEEIMMRTAAEQQFLDDRYEWDGFYVEKTCTPFREGGNAIVVILGCFTPDQKKIAEYKEILLDRQL